MRTLKYKVEEQLIHPLNDTDNIYKGFKNYLQLQFEFDENWIGCIKGIAFVVGDEQFYLILKNDCCVVPEEAINDYICFYIVGKKKDYRIQTKTQKIRVR